MSYLPLIGLPGRRRKGRDIAGFAEALGDLDMDLYLADYGRGVIEAGGLPVNIPLDADIDKVTERLDGVLLTGGTDIDPSRYGATAVPEVIGLEPERDELELSLLTSALARDIPVLGICRGLQILNVHQGGTLNQHVPPHSRYDVAPHETIHEVTFTAESTLEGLYGPTHSVNSLHHQTVDVLGEGLTVTGRAPDGVVEGLELGGRVVAVQWHPEMMKGRPADPLFRWLVETASQAN